MLDQDVGFGADDSLTRVRGRALSSGNVSAPPVTSHAGEKSVAREAGPPQVRFETAGMSGRHGAMIGRGGGRAHPAPPIGSELLLVHACIGEHQRWLTWVHGLCRCPGSGASLRLSGGLHLREALDGDGRWGRFAWARWTRWRGALSKPLAGPAPIAPVGRAIAVTS